MKKLIAGYPVVLEGLATDFSKGLYRMKKYTSEDLQKKSISELIQDVLFFQQKVEDERQYGLVWDPEKVPDQTVKACFDSIPVLTPRSEKDVLFDASTEDDVLIKGDNFQTLTALELINDGSGIADMIYIDPPYFKNVNNGRYTDCFNDNSAVYRHSAWLNVMQKRLLLAQDLLKDTGAIFISIDDIEQSNLKLLCDSIFGESNFIGLFPWRKRTAKKDVPHGISQDFEWIVAYAKSPAFNAFSTRENKRRYFETPDFPGRAWRAHDLTKQCTAIERPKSNFAIVNPKNGKKYPANPNRVWAITEDTVQSYIDQNRLIFPGDYPFLKIKNPQLRYWKDEDVAKAVAASGSEDAVSSVSTLLPKSVGMTQDGTANLSQIFGSKEFPFPKPVNLIKYLVKLATANIEHPLILDFFAGSGTTGQAVLELNQEDDGDRRFILVTNNENSIFDDVLYPRVVSVAKGYESKGKRKEVLFSSKLSASQLEKGVCFSDILKQTRLEKSASYSDIKGEVNDGLYQITGMVEKGEHVPGIPANIHCFDTELVPVSESTDQTKFMLAQKCCSLLLLLEGTFKAVSVKNDLYFFKSYFEDKYTIVFTGFANKKMVSEIESLSDSINGPCSLYVFSLSNDVESFKPLFSEAFLKKVVLKPIPSHMFEIYQQTLKDIRVLDEI